MKVFIVSDTHFAHRNMIKYTHRPEGFDELIVDNWNKLVDNEDLVIHLGDVCLAGSRLWDHFVGRLKGRKILVRGNHDSKSYKRYMEIGFDFVCDSFSWTIYGKRVLFTHIPVIPLTEGYDVNVHGHVHTRKDYKESEQNRLFSLEDMGYRPVLLKTFLERNIK